MLADNMSMTFNVDSTIRKIVIEASKNCGGLQLFASNETQGKPLKWFLDIQLLRQNIVKYKTKLSLLNYTLT